MSSSTQGTGRREADRYYHHRGFDILLRNINWTDHLDKAWQALWYKTPASPQSRYGETLEEALEYAKMAINKLLFDRSHSVPPTVKRTRREAMIGNQHARKHLPQKHTVIPVTISYVLPAPKQRRQRQ